MPDVVLAFEVHQPYRLDLRLWFKLLEQKAAVKPIDLEDLYFDHELNRRVFERVSKKCYEPATKLFLELLDECEWFKVTFSFSGVVLEQAERWAPDLLDLFKQIAGHDRCEVLGQTYYHSLAYLLGSDEFREQVKEHRRAVKDLLGVWPTVFENTELIYDNGVAKLAEELGFKAVITEGVEKLLGWRSPNYVYRAKGSRVKLLLRNYRLSDDIGFRFASRDWDQYPLTAGKYAAWLSATPGQVVLVFMDYETVGEHFPAETGIFEFFRWLPREVRARGLRFATPSEVVEKYEPVGEVDASSTVSWADLERDLSAWLGNPMQRIAFERVKVLGVLVKALGSESMVRVWRLLTMSDHFYYASTKGGGPGEVHSYFSPYPTPYHAFEVLVEALSDLAGRLATELAGTEASLWVRRVEKGREFRFYESEGRPLPYAAESGAELIALLRSVPVESLEFHVEKGHLSSWLKALVGGDAADAIEKVKGLKGEELRERLASLLIEEFRKALSRSKSVESIPPSRGGKSL